MLVQWINHQGKKVVSLQINNIICNRWFLQIMEEIMDSKSTSITQIMQLLISLWLSKKSSSNLHNIWSNIKEWNWIVVVAQLLNVRYIKDLKAQLIQKITTNLVWTINIQGIIVFQITINTIAWILNISILKIKTSLASNNTRKNKFNRQPTPMENIFDHLICKPKIMSYQIRQSHNTRSVQGMLILVNNKI